MDAPGATPADARTRAAALRASGVSVETFVLDARHEEELLYGGAPGAASGPDILPADEGGLSALRARLRATRADLVLWASATPGGGDAARAVAERSSARWWPTGLAGPARPGPLQPLLELDGPCDGSCVDLERLARGRLSLWDGPFVLLPVQPGEASAGEIMSAFAAVCEERGEVDLVVLDRSGGALDQLASDAGLGLRVHFVGTAPRDAESAWLGTASLALVPGESGLSGGWLLRALALGCPLLPVGAAAAPLAEWLAGAGAAWRGPASAGEAISRALERGPAVERAREAGRRLASAHDVPMLAAAFSTLWRSTGPDRERAA